VEGRNDTNEVQRVEPIAVLNRGLSRHGASPINVTSPYPTDPSDALLLASTSNPWEALQWWESPWQARIGIRMLARWPFLRLHHGGMDQRELLIPTRVLYPYGLLSSQNNRIEDAADTVAAAVRQAKEMYLAAQTSGVTDLSRPLLYFYGALDLAKAVTAALFGADALGEAHGLGTGNAPTVSSNNSQWPTLIEWRGQGQFPMFYRAARWDELYACCYKDSRWQGKRDLNQPLRFHVLECIRALQYPWGTLPPTGFPAPGGASFNVQMRPGLLLPYADVTDLYLTSQTSRTKPLVQVPRVVVQYMLLYYFSIIARYHPAEWQRLLAADREPEGYVFRAAMERVAQDFVHEIARLLPNTLPPAAFRIEEWSAERPALVDWYIPPSELVGTAPGIHMNAYVIGEWDGQPKDRCKKADQLGYIPPGP
jgi:YaaC-like Protein